MGYGSEAIIQRIGRETNRGIVSTPLSDIMQVKYNRDDPDDDHTLLHILADWADTHHHRLLIPFSANCSIEALRSCDMFAAIDAEKQYVSGSIVASGQGWRADAPPATPGYTTPDDYLASEQLYWVALDDVEHGDRFDFTDWWTSPSRGTEMNPLEQMFDNSKVAMMYASRIRTR